MQARFGRNLIIHRISAQGCPPRNNIDQHSSQRSPLRNSFGRQSRVCQVYCQLCMFYLRMVFSFFVCLSGAVLSPYVSLFQVPRYLLGPCTAAIDVCPFGLLYISPMIDWLMMMKIIFWSNRLNEFGRGNRSTRRKPAPAPLCPPQNPTWRRGVQLRQWYVL
jgi:hypothetical protein